MTIHLSLIVESDLDEHVLRQVIIQTGKPFHIDHTYGKTGKTELKKRSNSYNKAAKHYPYILLVDLDNDECPPSLIREWLPSGCHPNFIFRVAVKEIEAWLIADQVGVAQFLGVAETKVPRTPPDMISDPKKEIISLARTSRYKEIREDLVPETKSTSKVGKNYNGQLTKFVREYWNLAAAMQNSPSLQRAFNALSRFEPHYDST